ncbi:MAG: hypothetical protein JNL67_07350 [Planctomycetaceae bacterium]|nr:hypothetical protein [Planctomycetaceae bacterium]
MFRRALKLLIVLFGCSTSLSHAQTALTENTLKLDDGAKPATVELDKFQFLVGRWVGTGLGGECEEVFLPIWNNTLTGSFRYAREGKLVFSEYFSMHSDDNGVALRLKHFHPDMIGWEEKDGMVKFPLIRVEENAAYFGGLTYKLVGPDELHVWVAMREKPSSEPSDAAFVFKRAKLEE